MKKMIGALLFAAALYALAFTIDYSIRGNCVWYVWATGLNVFIGFTFWGTRLFL